ncbi:MAG: cytochrome c [Bacteroidetes bacterium]|nr:cytochrome c [Bacteroidota bacterium]
MFLLLNPTDAKSNSFENGKMVWQKYNCQSCHQIYGLGGYLGPDLTNVYQKGGEAYIRGMVQSGTDVMPAFKMSNSELDALEIYFKNMNQSGVSDPREFVVEYDGFIRLK